MGQGGDVLSGDDKQVNGCQRVNIREDDDIFILIHDFGGYLSGDNLAENAVSITHLPHPLTPSPLKERGKIYKRGGSPPLILPLNSFA
jgi:hypothetical protein